MPILARYEQQPGETLDYDFDFYTNFLSTLGDTAPGPGGLVVTVEPGLTLQSSSLTDGRVKVWLSGGKDGSGYKVTATVTTTGGRVKQAEIYVKVKEV